MKRKHLIYIGIIAVLLLPLWMWVAWLITPKKKLVAAIIDKTALTATGQEHLSLTWVLNHEKFTKTSGKGYSAQTDFFGFQPRKNEKYKLKGLERFSAAQLNQLSMDCDLTYYTDTYGVYINDWYSNKNNVERSGMIYGGMSQQDIEFLKMMKQQHKLIITEFNTISSPTTEEIRVQFERMFALKSTGWTCRFFNSFDTTDNNELPPWLINNYKNKNKGHWPFKRAGLAFVNKTDEVVILEDSLHLNFPVPVIKSTGEGVKMFGIASEVNYPFWFDLMAADTSVNKVIASFFIDVNVKGAEELNMHGIPANIPAVTMHKGDDYEFYYFSGDFSDNPLTLFSSYFKGIELFKGLLYSKDDAMERVSFFWNFYKPLLTVILKDYYQRRRSKR